ncbi:MAG TPA: SLC13 family permease, partial [Pyrinomonadaceae bacterium]|nr:SLC13 family permease [Pyrinomonadaceae bacterium]
MMREAPADDSDSARSRTRPFVALALVCIGVSLSLICIRHPILKRVTIVASVCLALWLTEVVPPYVPTLVLWALTPLLLFGQGDRFSLTQVLGWSANPVLALFLGGFALSVAASRYGIDSFIARLAVHWSRGSRLLLLCLTMAATALLSMWMSNIAAAAMMIAALHPLFFGVKKNDSFRRALLMGIAISANFGGIATPIGTGPNAIAIAAVSSRHPITFTAWMVFALPLALGLILGGLLLLTARFRVRGTARELSAIAAALPSKGARWVMIVFSLSVVAWLSEPIHGVPAAVVALITTAVLFGSGLLKHKDLAKIDWSTLLLIAGGIGLGNLLEQGGAIQAANGSIPWEQLPHAVRLFALCFASALLSALMSNTAAATILIPLAAGIDPAPSTAILIAIAASLGIPFVISTPPNAMV